MIRMPTIAIHRPWPLPRGRRQPTAPTSMTEKAERAMARERINALADAERTMVLSASVHGQRLI